MRASTAIPASSPPNVCGSNVMVRLDVWFTETVGMYCWPYAKATTLTWLMRLRVRVLANLASLDRQMREAM